MIVLLLYRLITDVRMYKKELTDFDAQREKFATMEDEGERNSKFRLIDNQVDETNLAIQDCLNRIGLAQADLYSALTSYPSDAHGDEEYKAALEAYALSSEVELAYDEDLVNQKK
jgi:hypothetical protein